MNCTQLHYQNSIICATIYRNEILMENEKEFLMVVRQALLMIVRWIEKKYNLT
jgi:hypothetical protein